MSFASRQVQNKGDANHVFGGYGVHTGLTQLMFLAGTKSKTRGDANEAFGLYGGPKWG